MSILLRVLGVLILLAVALIAAFVWFSRPVSTEQAVAEWMGENDRMVEVNGESWRIRESGLVGAPVFVMVHGFSHSLEAMDVLAERFNASHRVIQIDLPAHGLTGPRADNGYSPVAMSVELGALLEELQTGPVVLLGHSLGGLVSWNLAADRPELVNALILSASGGYPNLGVGDEPAEIPTAMRLYLTQAPMAMVEAANALNYFDPSKMTDAEVERIQAMLKIEGNGQALISLLEQFTLPDPTERLSRITAPTLVVWGQEDAFVPVEHAQRFATDIDQAQVAVIENAGHRVIQEQPDEVTQAINTFLSARAD